jgi:hypothetical protein
MAREPMSCREELVPMAKTVVGTFDSVVEAETAADALASSGLDRRAMAVIDNKAGRQYESQWKGQPGAFWSWLFGDVGDEHGGGFPTEDSARYTEQLGRGAVFLVVTVADGQAVRVQDLMQRDGAHDVWTPTGATKGGAGKSRSPVRVYTHTMERPVEEHIRLREDRVGASSAPCAMHGTRLDVPRELPDDKSNR